MMNTRGDTRFDFLDHLRGIAILAVVAYHWLGIAFGRYDLPWRGAIRSLSVTPAFLVLSPLCLGYLGVAVFFVISGFCIQLSYARNPHAGLRAFYLRRFFRIYPPYLVALLLYAIAFPPTRLGFATRWDWAQLGSHLFLVHNLDARSLFGINGAFWSLAVEVQLYLLFPVLVALVSRLGWKRTLLYIGVLELSIRGFAGIYYTVVGSTLPAWFEISPFAFWYSWSIGAYLADEFLHGHPLPFSRSPIGLWLVLVPLTYFVRPLAPLTFVCVCILTASCIARRLTRGRGGNCLMPSWLGPLQTTGLWSHSLYLLHAPLIAPAVELSNQALASAAVRHLSIPISLILSFLITVPLYAL